MKILIYNWRDFRHPQAGGAETFLHEQAKLWANQGHKVTWITSKPNQAPSRETYDNIDFIRKGGKTTLYLLSPFMGMKERKEADIIIDAENGFPFFTPLFSRKKHALLIHHIHKDVWFKEFNFPIAHIGYILENHIMPFVYRNSHIITVSPSSKNEIEKLMPNSKISIVYNAISKDYKPGKKASKPELIFLGRLKKYKSIDVLLKAVSLIDKNLIVHIVGRGDDESRLKKIVSELKLKKVIFHGFVSEKEKARLMQRAWIGINPSFVEGWSITNVELNACGTPVIGSNVHGIKDSIIDSKTGYLFPYGEHKALADKITLLLKNKILRKRIEKNAINWAKKFSWESSANRFLDILKNI